MHIQLLEATHIPPLENVRIICDPQVNLFIGPNSSGKSTLLRAINKLHSLPYNSPGVSYSPIFYPGEQPDPAHIVGYSKFIDFYGCNGELATFSLDTTALLPQSFNEMSDEMSLVYIPATRINLAGRNVFDPLDRESDRGYGGPLTSILANSRSDIFRGPEILYSIELGRGDIEYIYDREQVRKALDIGYSCAKQICDEVIYDNAHHWTRIGTSDDVLGDPLAIGDLSSGTQGTLIWIWQLAFAMVTSTCGNFSSGWENQPAILLIDEIENHLHPTWQRRVILALLAHFPGLQIFATTHSPFVVAGLKAGQVHLLDRDANGRVTATTNTEDVIGWTADEILRTMMGVDDPTDDATAAAAHELRQLRQEPPRTNPEAEALRQERMQELRQQVDRDLLAGGPMKAQRELFEQQFADVMKRYRQNQELNQENG